MKILLNITYNKCLQHVLLVCIIKNIITTSYSNIWMRVVSHVENILCMSSYTNSKIKLTLIR